MDTTQVIQQAVAAGTHQEPSLLLLSACLFIGAAVHFLKKAKRLQEHPDFDAASFWKAERFTIAISILTCIGVLISKENISSLKIGSYVVGAWLYPAFIGFGYFSDSLIDWFTGGYEKILKGKK